MKYEIYRDKADEYRWRFVASNGRIMADSSEGYDTKAGCRASLAVFRDGQASATIVDLTIDMESAISAGHAVAEIERRRRDDNPDPVDVAARDGIGSEEAKDGN